MMKFFKSAAALLMSAAAAVSICLPLSASAASEQEMEKIPVDPHNSILIDEANSMNSVEFETIEDGVYKIAEYIDMNVIIYVSGTPIGGPDSDTMYFCENFVLDNFGKDEDTIMLYLDLAGMGDTSYAPYDFIYTRNRARFYYPGETDDAENRIASIFSQINPFLPRGDEQVYKALTQYISSLQYYYDKGPSDLKYFYVPDTDSYVYLEENKKVSPGHGKYLTLTNDNKLMTSDSRPKNWKMGAVVGIVTSLVISLITFFCIKSHYKFKTAPSALHYLKADKMQMTLSTDTFIRKYQIRTKIQSSSGGGGGGLGGGTHSGGGGGGNHR